jgi:hypothetical protein
MWRYTPDCILTYSLFLKRLDRGTRFTFTTSLSKELRTCLPPSNFSSTIFFSSTIVPPHDLPKEEGSFPYPWGLPCFMNNTSFNLAPELPIVFCVS